MLSSSWETTQRITGVIGYYILPVPLRFKIGLGKIHQSLSALPDISRQTFPNFQFDIITVHVDMGYF